MICKRTYYEIVSCYLSEGVMRLSCLFDVCFFEIRLFDVVIFKFLSGKSIVTMVQQGQQKV